MQSAAFSVEGPVTEIYQEIFCFTVEKVKVHAIFNVLNGNYRLPELGTIVRVASPFYNTNGSKVTSMVLSPDENQEMIFFTTNYVQLIRELNVTHVEYLQVAKAFDDLVKHFVPQPGITHEHILQNVVAKLNAALNFELIFPTQMKYIDKKFDLTFNFSDMCKDLFKEYFIFGNHWNYNNNLKKRYLFGYFKMDKSGVLVLTDFKREIPCIITGEWNNLECYVLIEDFFVTTEIYNSTSFAAIEYLIVDASKIIKIDITTNEENVPTEAFLSANNYMYFKCYIVRKSVYVADSQTKSVFWIEIVQDGKSFFLSCDESYLNVYYSLKLHHNYVLYCKTQPRSTFNKAVSVMNSTVPQLELGPGSYFIPVPSPDSPPVMDVSEAIKHLKSSNLVTFVGTIFLKKFVSKLPSATPKLTNDPKYDTPGHQTHLLEFRVNSEVLSVYLNNWENKCLPYGLIPGMKVIVHNVKAQRERYYKSTVMTWFEIVKYELKVRFESANLCRPDWGVPFYLGAKGVIPKGTVIWSKPYFVSLQELRIGLWNQSINAVIQLLVHDAMGEAIITANNKQGALLLRHLLGLQEPLFEKWCQCVHLVAPFTYSNGMNASQYTDKDMKGALQRTLVRYFSRIGGDVLNLEFMCRTIEELSGKPTYELVQFRRG